MSCYFFWAGKSQLKRVFGDHLSYFATFKVKYYVMVGEADIAEVTWNERSSGLGYFTTHSFAFWLLCSSNGLCVHECLGPCMHIHIYLVALRLSLMNISWATPLGYIRSLSCFYYWIKTRYLPNVHSKNVALVIYLDSLWPNIEHLMKLRSSGKAFR